MSIANDNQNPAAPLPVDGLFTAVQVANLLADMLELYDEVLSHVAPLLGDDAVKALSRAGETSRILVKEARRIRG